MVWELVEGAGGRAPDTPLEPRKFAGDPEPGLVRMEQDCGRRVAEAHQAGLRDGEAAARSQPSPEVLAVLERLATTMDELARMRPQLRRQAESDVVKLSVAIARRILHRELAVDPEALKALIVVALEKLRSQEICRVRVHPSQEALLKSCLERYPNGPHIQVIADASQAAGAALFETTRGNLDASVESQLHEIEQGLADRLQRHS